MEQISIHKRWLGNFLNMGSDMAVVSYEGNSHYSLGPWKAKVFWRIAVRQYRVCILVFLLVLLETWGASLPLTHMFEIWNLEIEIEQFISVTN